MKFFLLTLSLVAAATLGCETECTLIGCAPELTIGLENTAGEDINDYSGRIVVDGESTSFRCTATPFPDGGGATIESDSSSRQRVFYLDGCFDSEAQFNFANERPSEVTLVFSAGDPVVTTTQTVSLVYRDEFPNGRDCGRCRVARVSIVID